jgi:hypothetical protein
VTDSAGGDPPVRPPAKGEARDERILLDLARILKPLTAETQEFVRDEIRKEREHRRRMDWVNVGLQAIGSALAAGTVVAYVWVSTYFVSHHAATQGAAILGGGAATLVGIFLGRRFRDRS